MLELLVLPACLLQDNAIIEANSALLDMLASACGAEKNALPIDQGKVFDAATCALLAHYQADIRAKKREQAILQVRITGDNGTVTWYGFAGLRPLPDSAYMLMTLQEDYAGQAYEALQEYIVQTPDFVMVVDGRHHAIIYSNKQTWLGYTLHDMVSSSWFLDYVHPEDVQRVHVFREQINRQYHRQTTIEYRVRVPEHYHPPDRDDGHDMSDEGKPRYEWIESRETALEVDAEGDCVRLLYHLTRITERKNYEYAISQRNRTLIAIQDISRVVNQSLDLTHVLAELLEHVQVLIPFTSASIFVIEGDKMRLLTQMNVPASVVERLQSDPFIIDKFTANLIERHKPHIIGDTYLEPTWQSVPETEYIRSWMGVPLHHHKDKPIGIINFDHETPHFYHQEHYGNASTIASHVALAIYNSRLYERAQAEIAERQHTEKTLRQTLARTDAMYRSGRLMIHSGQLEPVLGQVLEQIRHALQADSVFLVTFDLMSGEPEYIMASPAKSQERIWMDFHRVTSGRNDPTPQLPENPLPVGQAVCQSLPEGRYSVATSLHEHGVLAALSQSTPFTPDDENFIIALASQLSVAIERDALDSRLQQYTQHLERMVAKATSTLQLERQRLQAILDATGEGILYMEDYVIQYANPAFCRMLDYRSHDLVGVNFKTLRYTQPALTSDGVFLAATTDSQPTRRDEYPLIRRDGQFFHASLTFSLIGQLGDKPMRMVAVVRDISRERALRQQQMRFISNAAHELRTPLTSFHLRLHMARHQGERAHEHLDKLENIYEYMKLLVEELLDLSRFEKGTITLTYDEVRLSRLIEETGIKLATYAQERNIKLTYDLAEKLYARIDSERIAQMLFIMLTNSINYSHEGGKVRVELREVVADNTHYASITFDDDGMGIEAELLPEQIFMPFSRPRLGMRHETGMGLAIAREIVRLHGGRIGADNKPDGGSTFKILLPLIPPELTQMLGKDEDDIIL